jgi:diaminopimelate epimerase
MTIPFYKLQIAGNGFILVDLSGLTAETAGELTPDRYAGVARRFCDRRFGVGASGVIFLSRDNTIRIFGAQGIPSAEADDAFLCVARYAFDSGRVNNKSIVFKTPLGEKHIDVLGAHEFRIATGSPFALLGGHIITPDSDKLVEMIERDGIRSAYSALHIHEDVVVAFPQSLGTLNYSNFSSLVQKTFPGKTVLPVIARVITRDTILVRTIVKKESGVCAAAAASLAAAVCAGSADREAVIMFEQTGSDGQPDTVIAQDRDNSRRIAVTWDTEAHELYAIGSGGYIFEGKLDVPPEQDAIKS